MAQSTAVDGEATVAGQPPTGARRIFQWPGLPGGTRVRILVSVVVLLAIAAVLSILTIRTILIIRLDERIDDAGQQEVLELDQLLSVGFDPSTGERFTTPTALFDAYLARNVPSNEEALVTFVDGAFYRSAIARYPLDTLPPTVLADWARLSSNQPGIAERATGTYETELGTAHFRVRRVVLGDSSGAFVVTILPAAELQDIDEVLLYGLAITLGLMVFAAGAAWLIAGRLLKPVRNLTDTARSISQSALTRRVEVQGTSEADEMARSFNAMLDRLQAVFRSQREFVQDASHELRDPLTIVSGHLQLLPEDPVERKRTIALVTDEIDRMGRIVDDLQLLADIEQPDFLAPEPMDLGLFTHELLEKVSALAPRSWEVDASADGLIVADRHRLTEAVINLAQNAVQHTGPDDTIALGSSVDGDEVRLWVRDTGIGISVVDQTRIFRRFTRGRDARRRYRGSGLGLTIVSAIAEGHGGRVELISSVGEGSTFTMVIPRTAIPPKEPG